MTNLAHLLLWIHENCTEGEQRGTEDKAHQVSGVFGESDSAPGGVYQVLFRRPSPDRVRGNHGRKAGRTRNLEACTTR